MLDDLTTPVPPLSFRAAKQVDIDDWNAAYREAQNLGLALMEETGLNVGTQPAKSWKLIGAIEEVLHKYPKAEVKVLLQDEGAMIRVNLGKAFVMGFCDPVIVFMALLTQRPPRGVGFLEVLVHREPTIKAHFFGEAVDVTIKANGPRYVFNMTSKYNRVAALAMA